MLDRWFRLNIDVNHAENGRGKTCLSTVLRSLATNNPTAIAADEKPLVSGHR